MTPCGARKTGDPEAMVGGRGGRRRQLWRRLRSAPAVGLLLLAARAAGAATPCALPAVYAVQVEERGAHERGGPGLVVSGARAGAGALAPGDALRQANGERVNHCADLERVAVQALASDLALLLGVERNGVIVAVALVSGPEVAETGPATVAVPAETAAMREPRATPYSAAVSVRGGAGDEAPTYEGAPAADGARAHARVGSARDAATSARSSAPRPAAVLPPLAESWPDLRHTAAALAVVLTRVDEAADSARPLALYERRLRDGEAMIAAADFGGEPAGASVRAVAEEILEYHRTARDIWRAKLDLLSRRGVDRRMSGTAGMPYFSDSQVPRWIARYPFLQASLVEMPRATSFLMPGEVAGRWNPNLALDLLWAQARAATARLVQWARGA
jgi:hypothetical protein